MTKMLRVSSYMRRASAKSPEYIAMTQRLKEEVALHQLAKEIERIVEKMAREDA